MDGIASGAPIGQASRRAVAADGTTTVGLFRRGELVLGFAADRLAEVARIVTSLPMLDCRRGCLGGIDLRGQHVPVIDLPVWTGAPDPGAAPALAAILSAEGRLVAVGVDLVLGLARLPLAPPAGGEAAEAGARPTVSAVIHDGLLVNIVDSAALATHPEVPTVPDRRSAVRTTSRIGRRQMIQFDVGGATLAIPAVEIHATLPRRTIARNALSGGPCLGSIDLPVGTVAVLSASALFGIGTPSASETSEVIVVPMGGGSYVGLAVERIQRIAEIDLARAVDIPCAPGEGLLAACLVDAGGAPLFLVDPEALRQDPRLRGLAAVTSGGARAAGPPTAAAAGPPARRLRERYLLVEAGRHGATPIGAVTRILPVPRPLIRVDCPDPRVLGLTVIGGEVIPLIRPAGPEFAMDGASRVLLVETPAARAAVAVRRVLGVVTPDWRGRLTAGGDDAGEGGGPEVIRVEPSAAKPAAREVHAVLDLAAEVEEVARVLPPARRARPAA